MSRVLAVRLDNAGDVLLAGPALRALAAGADRLDLLVSAAGAPAAELLPGVDDVLVFDPPWSGMPPAEVSGVAIEELLEVLRCGGYDEAVIFTSYHQSPLPMALLAKLAGIGRVAASSDDYPGSLLDVRHRRMGTDADDLGGPEGGHEVTAALTLAQAAGYALPLGDNDRLRLREDLPDLPAAVPSEPYVVVHPGASAPSRGIPRDLALDIGRLLADDAWRVVVTGGPGDLELARACTPFGAVNLAGQTDFATLATVLRHADAVVVGNTAPTHLAAAVGTPVVTLFAPVVPVERWGPWRVSHRVLGDQSAGCAGTRVRKCPVPGHPCVSAVEPERVLQAVRELVASGLDSRSDPGTEATAAAPPAVAGGASCAS